MTKNTKLPLTVDRIAALASKAYRRVGYRMVTFNDGSVGVLNAPGKLIDTMNWFQAYITEALGLGTVQEPPHCVVCKRDIPFDRGATCHRKKCQIRPAAK